MSSFSVGIILYLFDKDYMGVEVVGHLVYSLGPLFVMFVSSFQIFHVRQPNDQYPLFAPRH